MTPFGRRHTVQVRHHDDSLEAANALAERLTRVLGVRVSRPEAYRIGVVLALGATDAALRAAAAGEAQRVEEDTPEEAARILREGGYITARARGNAVVYHHDYIAIESDRIWSPYSHGPYLQSHSRVGMSWMDAANELLRRWPPKVTP